MGELPAVSALAVDVLDNTLLVIFFSSKILIILCRFETEFQILYLSNNIYNCYARILHYLNKSNLFED